MHKESIKSFTDLKTWQVAHELALSIYKITTDFPKKELYGLSDQMRRCAVSVTSNIAEGFNRKTNKDKIHFYTMAMSSLAELESQLYICRDVDYIETGKCKSLIQSINKSGMLLNGLKRSIDRHPETSSS